MYQYWTDLGLIALNIYSDISLKDGMMSYKEKISGAHKKEIVRIYLYDISRYYEFPFEAVTYREKMMQKGYYIGHYFGDPIKIKVISFNEIHLCAKDYDRVLWSFITKYLITIFCIEKGYLHIKAAVAERNNKAFLIVGRGGSGKTEFLKKLCENGLNYVANTHSIINGNDVFGINTNIRIRNVQTILFEFII